MEMEYLRWILLGAAIVLVVAVYFFSRVRKKDQYHSPLDAANDVPSFSIKEQAENEWMHGVGPVRVVSAEFKEPASDINQDKVKFSATEVDELKDDFEIERSVDSEEPVEAVEVDDVKAPDHQEDHQEDQQIEEVVSQEKFTEESITENQLRTENSTDEHEPVEEQIDTQTDNSDVAVDDVISVYVLAQPGEMIKGEKILSASYALHMDFGAMKIFHRHDQDEERKIQFSMANIKQPGWFEIDRMHELETPGVSFFMQVNLVEKPSAVLDEMMITAHGLSSMIGATLCGAQRKPLDETQTNELREKVKRLENLKSQSV